MIPFSDATTYFLCTSLALNTLKPEHRIEEETNKSVDSVSCHIITCNISYVVWFGRSSTSHTKKILQYILRISLEWMVRVWKDLNMSVNIVKFCDEVFIHPPHTQHNATHHLAFYKTEKDT